MQPRNITGHSFFTWDGDVLVVNILGKPSASCDAIGKSKGNQLKVSVTATPVRGKATDHMLRYLAPLFGVTPSEMPNLNDAYLQYLDVFYHLQNADSY